MAPTNQQLFTGAYSVLRPGGTIAILDSLADDVADPLGIALYNLDLSLRTQRGRLHSFVDDSAGLGPAGFADMTRTYLGEQVSLVKARRARG